MENTPIGVSWPGLPEEIRDEVTSPMRSNTRTRCFRIDTTMRRGELDCAATVCSLCDLSLRSPLRGVALAPLVPANMLTTSTPVAIERNAGETLPLTIPERRTQTTPTPNDKY